MNRSEQKTVSAKKAIQPKLAEVRLQDIILHPAYPKEFIINLALDQPNRSKLKPDAVCAIAQQIWMCVEITRGGDYTKSIFVVGVRDYQILRTKQGLDKCTFRFRKIATARCRNGGSSLPAVTLRHDKLVLDALRHRNSGTNITYSYSILQRCTNVMSTNHYLQQYGALLIPSFIASAKNQYAAAWSEHQGANAWEKING